MPKCLFSLKMRKKMKWYMKIKFALFYFFSLAEKIKKSKLDFHVPLYLLLEMISGAIAANGILAAGEVNGTLPVCV